VNRRVQLVGRLGLADVVAARESGRKFVPFHANHMVRAVTMDPIFGASESRRGADRNCFCLIALRVFRAVVETLVTGG